MACQFGAPEPRKRKIQNPTGVDHDLQPFPHNLQRVFGVRVTFRQGHNLLVQLVNRARHGLRCDQSCLGAEESRALTRSQKGRIHLFRVLRDVLGRAALHATAQEFLLFLLLAALAAACALLFLAA